MTLIILGLILWSAVHLFKRAMPDSRAAMTEKMGEASKGVIAVLLVLSVVLMVIGYRGAEGTFYWGRTGAMTGVNNLLMLLSVALFGTGGSKSRLRGKLRHPMLLGMIVWAVAHLLVNGDTPSFVLFGGLAIWAVAEIVVLNRTTPEPAPFTEGTVQGDVKLLVISLVVYAVIAGVHTWLGYLPFG